MKLVLGTEAAAKRHPRGTDITDNGMPAEFDICPLLHVAAIEPFNLQDSPPAP